MGKKDNAPKLRLLASAMDLLMLPLLLPLALASRMLPRSHCVGLGPEPLINNAYHKRALELAGYSARTYVNSVYYITDKFDIRYDLRLSGPLRPLRDFWIFLASIASYKCLYIYFTGGPLGGRPLLWRFEPLLLKLAGVKTLVMPYGSDIQDMSRTGNLLFKHAQSKDYPGLRLHRAKIAAKIDLWTSWADHVVSGCDWVEYTYHWDTLTLAHFSIDTKALTPKEGSESPDASRPLRILHAPNHRNIKGTEFFVKAVEELQAEGVPVELAMVERAPNAEVCEAIANADVIADQLIVGWYAMFALEGMSMGKPVICHCRADLEELFVSAGLLQPGELPVVNCSVSTVKDGIRKLALNRDSLADLGRRSREFAVKRHSLEAVGKVFASINEELGLAPDIPEALRGKAK